MPVVDSEGKLKGIITSRDLAGILSKLTSLEWSNNSSVPRGIWAQHSA